MNKINFSFYKVIVALILISLTACADDDNENDLDFNEKWVLIKMTGNVPDSETTGSEMEWQEFYVFSTGNTVTKSRERDDVVIEISGTYILTNYSTESLLEITYFEESEIIGTCSSDLSEELYFKPDNILYNTWQNCDGPGLSYEKQN